MFQFVLAIYIYAWKSIWLERVEKYLNYNLFFALDDFLPIFYSDIISQNIVQKNFFSKQDMNRKERESW